MMIVDCHIYAAILVAMKLSSSISKVHKPAWVMLKPFSATEAPHKMKESMEESNVLFKKEKHMVKWTWVCQHSKSKT